MGGGGSVVHGPLLAPSPKPPHPPIRHSVNDFDGDIVDTT